MTTGYPINYFIKKFNSVPKNRFSRRRIKEFVTKREFLRIKKEIIEFQKYSLICYVGSPQSSPEKFNQLFRELVSLAAKYLHILSQSLTKCGTTLFNFLKIPFKYFIWWVSTYPIATYTIACISCITLLSYFKLKSIGKGNKWFRWLWTIIMILMMLFFIFGIVFYIQGLDWAQLEALKAFIVHLFGVPFNYMRTTKLKTPKVEVGPEPELGSKLALRLRTKPVKQIFSVLSDSVNLNHIKSKAPQDIDPKLAILYVTFASFASYTIVNATQREIVNRSFVSVFTTDNFVLTDMPA